MFSGINDEHLIEVAAALQGNTSVRSVKLSFNEDLTDVGLTVLLKPLRGSSVVKVSPPIKASDALRKRFERICAANRSRIRLAEEAKEDAEREEKPENLHKAPAKKVVAKDPTAGLTGVEAERAKQEGSLKELEAAAELAAAESAREVALRVGKRRILGMRKAYETRQVIRSEVDAENEARREGGKGSEESRRQARAVSRHALCSCMRWMGRF